MAQPKVHKQESKGEKGRWPHKSPCENRRGRKSKDWKDWIKLIVKQMIKNYILKV